jgi:hypothetical protein
MRWYLAGPMSGYPESNYPAFGEAAKFLRSIGYDIVSPHETKPVQDDSRWQECIRHDISTLATCHGIVLLSGWSRSKGARLELTIATQLGMFIHFYDDGHAVDIT